MTIAAVLYALAACKPEPPVAFLGKYSDAVLAHFASTCKGQLTKNNLSPPFDSRTCNLAGLGFYQVLFHTERGRIESLSIFGTLAEARAVFDRAFAPILPDETAEVLRRTLQEPLPGVGSVVFRRSSGAIAMFIGDVDRLRAGERVTISWHMQNHSVGPDLR